MNENGNNNYNTEERLGAENYGNAGQNVAGSGNRPYYSHGSQSAPKGMQYDSQSRGYVSQRDVYSSGNSQYQGQRPQYPSQRAGYNQNPSVQHPGIQSNTNPYLYNNTQNAPGNTSAPAPDNGDDNREKKIIVIIVAAILCIAVICGAIFAVVKIIGDEPETTEDETTEEQDDTSRTRYKEESTTSRTRQTTTVTEDEYEDPGTENNNRYTVTIGNYIAEVYCDSSAVSSSDINTFLDKIKNGVSEQKISMVLVLSDDSSYLGNTGSLLSDELSEAGLGSTSDAVILSINTSSGSCSFNATGRAEYAVYDRRTEWYQTEAGKLCNGYSFTNMSTMVDEFVAETENITEGIIPFTASMTSCQDSYTCHTKTSGSTVNIRLIPGDTNSDVMGQLKDSNTIRVYYIYTNSSGEEYGFIDIKDANEKRASGWVPMEYLQ